MSELDLPQGITAVTENGLPAFRIETPAATGLVHTHGAHVTAWAPAGQDEVIWVSSRSEFSEDSAIRGGIPICFPWFGPGRSGDKKPSHGFARTAEWNLVEADVADDGAARVVLELTGDRVADLGGFPADFTARLSASFGAQLDLSLTVVAGDQALDYEEALHTYFRVTDVRQVRIEGLDQASYLDKTDAMTEKQQQGPVTFSGETDRIYLSESATTIVDGARRVTVEKALSGDTVVWNPWSQKAAGMSDFGDDEWTSMVCVETANALAHAVRLEPGQSHAMTASITVA